MSESMGEGLADTEQALQREAQVLADRFPDVPVTEIEARLQDTFDELDGQATVKSHLVAVTGNQVASELRAEASEQEEDGPAGQRNDPPTATQI